MKTLITVCILLMAVPAMGEFKPFYDPVRDTFRWISMDNGTMTERIMNGENAWDPMTDPAMVADLSTYAAGTINTDLPTVDTTRFSAGFDLAIEISGFYYKLYRDHDYDYDKCVSVTKEVYIDSLER